MEPTDLTIEILKGIREDTRKTSDGVRKTNERLDALRTELHVGLGDLRTELHTGLGDLRTELVARQTETEVRLATEIVGVAGAVREVRDLLREDRKLRDRVDDHERRISAMEQHTG